MKALVLSSGGVDSTTCLALAVEKLGAANVVAVSFYYGQKHARELTCARAIATHYGSEHYEFDIAELFRHSDCALLAHSTQEISPLSYAAQMNTAGRVSTYVPFRNGLMLSMAASLADSLFTEETEIYLGAHADDAAGEAYADCGQPFIKAMGEAVSIGTYGKIKLIAPFAGQNKAAVVKTGLRLKVPYELTWSCYESGEVPCGQCATCRDRSAAFKANNAPDPALTRV